MKKLKPNKFNMHWYDTDFDEIKKKLEAILIYSYVKGPIKVIV